MKASMPEYCGKASRLVSAAKRVLLLALVQLAFTAGAQELTNSTTIHFRQSHWDVDTALADNGRNIGCFIGWLDSIAADTSATYRLKSVQVAGAASPEGTAQFNGSLSARRAQSIYDLISRYIQLPDSLTTEEYEGRDWRGLLRMIDADTLMPARNEAMSIVSDIVTADSDNLVAENRAFARLKRINGGRTYRYMYSRMFPSLRYSRLTMEYEREALPEPFAIDTIPAELILDDTVVEWIPDEVTLTPEHRPFYMALKTNLIHDALALPEIGAEFYVGRNWSVVGNWTYGWWDNDHRHRYWRAYGGDVAVRRWFGRLAEEKPLTGHHIGAYAGAVTYDFEFGGKGVMGGRPHRTIFDRCNFYCGVEYGFSLPVRRRLNIDFTIGIGYFGGNYIKYEPSPSGRGYTWQSTHHINWFGPTKAEISLVWLIGRDNYNNK